MNIKLMFVENLKAGLLFHIPIDSETDEYLSGRIQTAEDNGNLYIKTDCIGAKNNMVHCLDIIHIAMDEIYREKTGKGISDTR